MQGDTRNREGAALSRMQSDRRTPIHAPRPSRQSGEDRGAGTVSLPQLRPPLLSPAPRAPAVVPSPGEGSTANVTVTSNSLGSHDESHRKPPVIASLRCNPVHGKFGVSAQ